MEVRKDLQIVHSPMIVTFDLDQLVESQFAWKIPHSWYSLVDSPQLIEDSYNICRDRISLDNIIQDHEKDGEELLHVWSKVVETSVDRTIQIQHHNQPEKFPTKGLPQSYKGRCEKRVREEISVGKGPKFDRHTGFEPPEEIFRLHSKRKVKQVRRLRSFIRARKSAFQTFGDNNWPSQICLQLKQEWDKILRANGYPGTWWKWLLSYECISYVPWDNPDDEFWLLAAQITENECNIACNEEAAMRDKFRSQKIRIDVAAGSGKAVYRILKGHQAKPLQQFPISIQVNAVLCRSSKEGISIRIDEFEHFMVDQSALFGDAEVRILHQNDRLLTVKLVKGVIPTRGLLKQSSHAYSPTEIFKEFHRYWAPIWLRENQREQFDPTAWNDFFQQLEDVRLPAFNLKVTLEDPEIWFSTIQRMKSHTAHGACGWRTEELKVLPKQAIIDLCNIFKKIWPSGMPPNLAQARVVMLEKNSQPKGIQDGRPITILSVLSRLSSKIIADQVLQQLSQLLPPQISGGLAARGTHDLSVQQHFRIEQAVSTRTQLGGYTLDLVKAFNFIPRCPLRRLFRLFGVPEIPTNFWFVGLKNLKRFPQVQGCLGHPVASTCGVPEGDSMSVLAMVLLSSTYFYKICSPKVSPFSYADNWSWLTDSEREQFKTMKTVLNFVATLKMKIDHKKSWAWGTTKQFRDSCQNLELLFPDGETSIVVRTSAKDLGYHLHYDRRITLDEMKERIHLGIQRCEKLRWIPLDVCTKARFIQQSVWPAALHAASSQVLGKRHFRVLRRSATKALLGDHKQASSFLACSCLSNDLDDPLLFVIIQIVRSIRRLSAYFPQLARDIVSFSTEFQGSVAYGPASALKKYLEKICWKLNTDGSMIGPAGFRAHLFLNSPKELKRIFRQAWGYVVMNEVQHRKGISEQLINHRLTCKVFQTFPPSEQVILALNVTAVFQSGTTKSFWDANQDGNCPFCGAPDTHAHRILDCVATKSIRENHPKAIATLISERPDWVWLPIARDHPEKEFLRHVFLTRAMLEVHIPEDKGNILETLGKYRFFTDGSCCDPTDEDARRSSWGIIWDKSGNHNSRTELASPITDVEGHFPELTCVATGLVGGLQSAARAELSAALHAVKISCAHVPPVPMDLYTDASYVVNVVSQISQIQQGCPIYKTPNFDIVLQLAELWDNELHHCFKVKAHRKIVDARDHEDAWKIVANHMADRAANHSLGCEDQTVIETASAVAEFNRKEFCQLKAHYIYVIELAKYRMKLLNEQKSAGEVKFHFLSGEGSNEGANQQPQELVNITDIHQQVCDTLSTVNNPTYRSLDLPEVSQHILEACSVGANVTCMFWKWLNLLQWPEHEVNEIPNPNLEWGVSYFELVVNYALCTGDFLPIPLYPNQRYVEYVAYSSNSGILLPNNKRAASMQVFAFEKLVRHLEALSSFRLIPKFPKATRINCRSLTQLGYKGQVAGISIRPNMPYPKETIIFVHKYIQALQKGGALDKPLIRPEIPSIISFPNLDEGTPKQRATAAARIRAKLAREKARAREHLVA